VIEVESPSNDEDMRRLLHTVEDVAEIPRALRAGARVERPSLIGAIRDE
jgi:hypothetical protein